MPHAVPDPLPLVVGREPDWHKLEAGPGQDPLTGTYEWSPDFDWYRDFRLVDNIKFTARPPVRPW